MADWSLTVYREADGVTVVRATGSAGSINETVIDRGLLTVSHHSVFATITAEYEGDVDAIFAFEPGAEITLRVRETRDDSTRISFDTYRIGEVVPFAIGDCIYPTVVIKSVGRTETEILPLVRIFYSRELGFVLGRDVYRVDGAQPVPLVDNFYDVITDDPASVIPR